MNLFSKYYDMFVGADYDKISSYISTSIKRYKPDSELLCDLGCGTATVALKLSLLGFDMIGIDSDEDMLTIANEKLHSSAINSVLLLNQNISDFELYGTVDVIYSTLDTLNYLTCKRDIDRVFRLVKNYLNYDGLFIFDVNTQYKFRDVLNNNCEVYNGDDVFCCWQSYFDAKSCLCTHELNYFERNNGGDYTRFNNFQIQRYYSHEYFKQLAEKYSFDILRISDDYTSKKVNDKSRRAVYTLKINK